MSEQRQPWPCLLQRAALWLLLVAACFSGTWSCARADPPGTDKASAAESRLILARSGAYSEPKTKLRPGQPQPGTINDNLPFEPDGTKLISTAWRTWVYTDTGPKRMRYGYLRYGSVVDARGPALKNPGCAGGWYRINPRGFVCLGKGATLDPNHPAKVQVNVRPKRGNGLPYHYALSKDSRPYLYFKLPTTEQITSVEGEGWAGRVAIFRERTKYSGLADYLGALGAAPSFLVEGQSLERPYGTAQPIQFSLHRGRAAKDSGFAFKLLFEWQDRAYGITTQNDLIALDRVNVVLPSTFRGVTLEPSESLPVGFVTAHYLPRYDLNESGAMAQSGHYQRRQALKLTGKRRSGGFLELRDGSWVGEPGLKIIKQRDSFPSVATGDRKWIDVSIGQQSLVAYVGERPVYVTLVSTGRGGMGDPETEQATIRGTFMIHDKSVSSTMDSEEDRADSYALEDVPFVQYFHKGFALHGTYWHDEFGEIRSHGCINLSPIDSAWLFEWTDPQVPKDWHGVINKQRGTVVYIHP